MITLLRLLLFLTFLQICALLCAGLRIHWRKKKRARVYEELRRCKLLYSLSAFSRIQAPRTPATCLLCRLRTVRNLSCSFLFKICAFHSCSKYATPIFVALALEVLATLCLLRSGFSTTSNTSWIWRLLLAIQRAWMCALSGVCLGGCFLISLESSEILVRF